MAAATSFAEWNALCDECDAGAEQLDSREQAQDWSEEHEAGECGPGSVDVFAHWSTTCDDCGAGAGPFDTDDEARDWVEDHECVEDAH